MFLFENYLLRTSRPEVEAEEHCLPPQLHVGDTARSLGLRKADFFHVLRQRAWDRPEEVVVEPVHRDPVQPHARRNQESQRSRVFRKVYRVRVGYVQDFILTVFSAVNFHRSLESYKADVELLVEYVEREFHWPGGREVEVVRVGVKQVLRVELIFLRVRAVQLDYAVILSPERPGGHDLLFGDCFLSREEKCFLECGKVVLLVVSQFGRFCGG